MAWHVKAQPDAIPDDEKIIYEESRRMSFVILLAETQVLLRVVMLLVASRVHTIVQFAHAFPDFQVS